MFRTGRWIATLSVMLIASTIEGADPARTSVEELLELAHSVPEHYDLAAIVSDCSHYIDENKVGPDERLTLFRLRGIVRLKNKNASAALADFRICQEAMPDDASINWLTARALATTGKFEEATTLCEKLKLSHPQFAPAFATSAVLHLRKGKTEEAIWPAHAGDHAYSTSSIRLLHSSHLSAEKEKLKRSTHGHYPRVASAC